MKSKVFHELTSIVCIAGVAGLLFAGASLIHAQKTSSSPSPTNSPSSKAQEVAGLILETPVRLRQLGEDSPTGQLKYFLNYGAETDGLVIGVASSEAVEGVPLSLANGAEGSVKSLLRRPDVKSPKYTIDDVTVSGIPAKKISFTALGGDREFYARGLLIVKGRQMWLVQILYRDVAKTSVAEGIIGSVRLK